MQIFGSYCTYYALYEHEASGINSLQNNTQASAIGTQAKSDSYCNILINSITMHERKTRMTYACHSVSKLRCIFAALSKLLTGEHPDRCFSISISTSPPNYLFFCKL